MHYICITIMEKKKRNLSVTKRFNSEDFSQWQEQANLTTGGNLTLWIELTLNKSIRNKSKSTK